MTFSDIELPPLAATWFQPSPDLRLWGALWQPYNRERTWWSRGRILYENAPAAATTCSAIRRPLQTRDATARQSRPATCHACHPGLAVRGKNLTAKVDTRCEQS